MLLADKMAEDFMADALPRCGECRQVLVGAEDGMCDPCKDALCPACGNDFVEFPVIGLPDQLCNDCHEKWVEWHDPVLDEIAVPLETDLQDSRARFIRKMNDFAGLGEWENNHDTR